MECSFCHVFEDLPFNCSYCKLVFCSSHRLPEKHQCSQLYRVHKPRETSYRQSNPALSINNLNSIDSRINRIFNTELRQLMLGMILVLLVGISFFLSNNYSYSAITILILGLVLMGSFLIHEMSHKFFALRNGYRAEFRVNSMGVLLTFFSIFPFVPLKIIAPGAVVISGYPSNSTLGKIALAGPISNIILGMSSIFILLSFSLTPELFAIISTAAYINGILAAFNLLPFSIIDGKKVYNWNKYVWLFSFLFCISFIFVVSNII